MTDYDPHVPTAEELKQMRAATPEEAAAVDQLLLSKCTSQWRKVAMVAALCLKEFDSRFPQLPYIYMSLRLLELAKHGAVETAGDLMSMRTSEVRLAGGGNEA
jgi:Protein of unknown function